MNKTEEEKFTELYRRYYRLMYHVAYGVLHSRPAAEDAVHTACVRILEHFAQVAEVDSPQTRSFAAIVTKRVALTEYARGKREAAADAQPQAEDIPCPGPQPTVAAEQRDARAALLAELHCLRGEDQDILLLKYDNDFTIPQIARALDMDAQVVKKRLQRARARLKSALEQKGYDSI